MEAVVIAFLRIQERIWLKLMAAGTISIESAVTVQEAQLGLQGQRAQDRRNEPDWLGEHDYLLL